LNDLHVWAFDPEHRQTTLSIDSGLDMRRRFNCKDCNGTGHRRRDVCGGTGEIEAVPGDLKTQAGCR
jgi:hypothetical protein